MNTFQIKRFWLFGQTETSFICVNKHNVHVELDKNTGEYLNGNLCNNSDLRPLFKALYKVAKEKFNK